MWYDYLPLNFVFFKPLRPSPISIFYPNSVVIFKSSFFQKINFFFSPLNNFYFFFPFYKFYKTLYPPKAAHLIQMSGIMFFFFRKIKFRGKGYYMYRNKRNTIVFRFGKSHRTYRYGFHTFLKVLSKTAIFFSSRVVYDLNFFLLTVFQVRPINLFTLRGIRFSRQLVYKKTGKISSYR